MITMKLIDAMTIGDHVDLAYSGFCPKAAVQVTPWLYFCLMYYCCCERYLNDSIPTYLAFGESISVCEQEGRSTPAFISPAATLCRIAVPNGH